MKNFILCVNLLLAGNAIAQTYAPVSVTGFNIDAVAETFPNSLATTTQALDQVVAGGNSVMYNVAFGTAAGFTGGLPNSGTIANGTKSYQLMPYTSNNALFAPSGSSNTLTLATPSQYSSISLLVFSTEGSSNINVTLNYTDLTSSNAGGFSIQDWFNGTGAIITGIGRCKRVTSGVTNDGVPSNPRFYSIDINLPCANQLKNLSSITIAGISSNPAGGGPYVMAVSGASVNMTAPTLTYSSNVYCQTAASITPTITGASGGTYSVNPSGISINSGTGIINLGSSSVNNYTITYSTPGTCPLSANYSLAINASPTLAVSNTTICNGATVTLSAGNGATTYSWNTGATTSTISVSPTTTSFYTVTGTTSGCTDTKTVSVNVDAVPVITLTPTSTTLCGGQNTTLNASGAATYTWLPSGSGTSSTLSPISTTIYTVIGSIGSCTSIPQTATINVNPIPTITLTPTSSSICSGQTTNITAATSVSGGTYAWLPNNQTTSSVSESPSSTTNYTVTYSVNGCTTSATSTIVVNTSPNVTINSVSVCAGESATITATPSLSGGNFVWSPNGEFTSSISDSPNSTSTYSVLYSLNGCTATATGSIIIHSNPLVTLFPSSNNVSSFESVTITATGGSSYLWNTGQTGSLITVSPSLTTTYCATVTSSAGCLSKKCIEIIVENASTLYIPNVFTPNGDGVNDIYFIPSNNIKTYNLKIFNRWGQLLFSTTDPLKGWDGSFGGRTISDGVYVYIVYAVGNDDVIYNKTGHITVLQ